VIITCPSSTWPTQRPPDMASSQLLITELRARSGLTCDQLAKAFGEPPDARSTIGPSCRNGTNSDQAEAHNLASAGYGVPHFWPELVPAQSRFGLRCRGVDRFEV